MENKKEEIECIENTKDVDMVQIINMFSLLPDVLFWIKSSRHCFVYANQAFVDHVGAAKLDDVIGKNDFDFAPVHVARQFIQDDKKVLAGACVTDRFEINQSNNGELAWFTTSKRPLKDKQGNVIGTYGITRHLQKTSTTLAHINAIKTPVEFIRLNYQKAITIEQLAQIAHLSVSALERRFKKYLAKTPKQFLTETRLEQARKLLVETSLPISSICFCTGFGDPSYFAKQFKCFFGLTPSQIRKDNYLDINKHRPNPDKYSV
ncbi:AraC family transcriptional regulator [Pseudoalteromonas sp. JBTF-M23]|uniref:AraC family transcriptional regulator n=2 Tax=Pseudoalteromonas caenipelagi TaxID=2726988 RepID=A0A849VIC8_9GAMM|nr:AraC family transcriptional regulator [Pseudoalteromonas caenipelagi]NOU52233.1 AraC family transcriptional regulator [Pseudoalteromonas caenipelagi]